MERIGRNHFLNQKEKERVCVKERFRRRMEIERREQRGENKREFERGSRS